jgi:hypothetical protein
MALPLVERKIERRRESVGFYDMAAVGALEAGVFAITAVGSYYRMGGKVREDWASGMMG